MRTVRWRSVTQPDSMINCPFGLLIRTVSLASLGQAIGFPMPSLLLVEDDFDFADIVVEILNGHGHEVRVARNGMAALHLLVQQPADLILLDLMLPVMSGTMVLLELARAPTLRQIPVVIVTATPLVVPPTFPRDRILAKPIAYDRLLEVIDHVLATSSAANQPP